MEDGAESRLAKREARNRLTLEVRLNIIGISDNLGKL